MSQKNLEIFLYTQGCFTNVWNIKEFGVLLTNFSKVSVIKIIGKCGGFLELSQEYYAYRLIKNEIEVWCSIYKAQ